MKAYCVSLHERILVLAAVTTLVVMPRALMGQEGEAASARRLAADSACGDSTAAAVLGNDSLKSTKGYNLTSGERRGMDGCLAFALRKVFAATNRGNFWRARPLFYGQQVYTPNFMDWLVYIRPNGVHEVLTSENRDLDKNVVMKGTRTVYVAVFLEKEDTTWAPAPVCSHRLPDVVPPPVGADERRLHEIVQYLTDKANAGRLAELRERVVGGKPEGPSLRISRNVLQFDRDPFLVRLVAGLGAKLLGGGSLSANARLVDTSEVVTLKAIGALSTPRAIDRIVACDLGQGRYGSAAATQADTVKDSVTTTLYTASAKFELVDDMWGRLNVEATESASIGKRASILRNFGALSGSPFGLSVGPGVAGLLGGTGVKRAVADTTITPGTPPDTATRSKLVRSGQGRVVNLYVLGHLKLWRTVPPLRSGLKDVVWFRSLSVAAGTNIAKDALFDHLVTAVSVDGVWGTGLNLVGGASWLESQTLVKKADTTTTTAHRVRSKRTASVFAALTFSF